MGAGGKEVRMFRAVFWMRLPADLEAVGTSPAVHAMALLPRAGAVHLFPYA